MSHAGLPAIRLVCGTAPGHCAAWRPHSSDAAAGRRFPPAREDLFSKTGVPGVKHVVAVASGKGGVGKSTVAVNLAVALAGSGKLRVGLVDADVYGPSIPTMMNLQGEPAVGEGDRLVPLENYGVRCMSMGFLMKAETAAVWRGPMALKALDQLIFRTAWGPLDVLVVDMPPGTGDIQITVAQRCKLSGAVMVSTPQEVALADVRRGITMFSKVNIPILGVVENMAFFLCGSCSTRHHIFGTGGVQRVAEAMGAEVIGQVPLEGGVASESDAGTPIVVSQPDSAGAAAFREVAERVKQALGLPAGEAARPP